MCDGTQHVMKLPSNKSVGLGEFVSVEFFNFQLAKIKDIGEFKGKII